MICQKCGAELPAGAAFCNYCGSPAAAEASAPTEPATTQTFETTETPAAPAVELGKPENVIAGMIGAIAGALLGGASIVLLDQLGFVASISGFLIAFLSLKGYEWLGGRLTKKGVVASIVLCLIVPLLAYFMSIAIYWTQTEPNLTLGMSFAAVLESATYAEFWGEIGLSVLMLYGFTALGAYSTISAAFKKNKQ